MIKLVPYRVNEYDLYEVKVDDYDEIYNKEGQVVGFGA